VKQSFLPENNFFKIKIKRKRAAVAENLTIQMTV
jgi:hypothetical protein